MSSILFLFCLSIGLSDTATPQKTDKKAAVTESPLHKEDEGMQANPQSDNHEIPKSRYTYNGKVVEVDTD